jgi:hypothetical protein
LKAGLSKVNGKKVTKNGRKREGEKKKWQKADGRNTLI